MDYSTLDDRTLVGLIELRRADALSELYDRYHRLVFSVAFNSVGDYGTAEEITQDVFVRVWEKAATYRVSLGQVNTWLSSIARHRSIDVFRRRSSRPESRSTTWDELPGWALPNVEGPEERAILAIQQQRVRASIAQLPEEQQQVLGLAYFKGYTQRQIAEMLDQPLGTVKTRIRLAMQKLRAQLQED